MTGIEILFYFIMGVCWGSFLNVLYVRTLSGESIVYPPSKCPKCEHRIPLWQNIPLVSYFMLKGKCYFCNRTISIRYPIVEFLGGMIFLFAFWENVSLFDAISVIFILSMFLVLSMTDMETKKVSKTQSVIIMAAGLVYNRYDVLGSILGGFTGMLLILAMIIAGVKFFNKETFGLGDIWLVGALGAVVGIQQLFLYLLYTLVLQFIMVFPKYVFGLIKDEQIETLKYLICFGITCFFLYVFRNISMFGSKSVFIGLLVVMLYLAYKLVLNLLKTMDCAKSHSYYPLAPTLAISCLIFLC